jgi:hypothetical protein
MINLRSSAAAAIALSLTMAIANIVATPFAQAAGSAVDQLVYLDKTIASGALDVRVDLYDPPNSKGRYGTPKIYPAKLLFARPDQFRLTLRPGAKDEFRAVGNAGLVNWIDYATGFSGKDKAENVIDPVAIALLGSVGELMRFAPAKELPVSAKSTVRGAKLTPKNYGTSVESATAWFSNDQPIGFEFVLTDRRRVFISVLVFNQNVPTKPSDFQL